jgi:Ca-activated chloride channel family protein
MLTVAAVTALVALATAWPAAQRQSPSFRSGVDVVSLNVTVTDAGSRYVTDLERTEFEVFEDGVRQDVTFFTRTTLPIALSLLIDTSASMEDKLATAQAAATGFARHLRPEDSASVIDFDSRVEILQGFTSDVGALEGAIRQTVAGGSTSLYNALYISLKELRKYETTSSGDIRRQAVIVLSDGEDTSSLVTFDEVLDLAKRSETAIYSIGIRSRESSAGKGFREAEFVLRQLCQETGGRAFFPDSVEALPAIYSQIAEDLSSQYTLGYTSKNQRSDGRWRRVAVRLSRQDVTPRTRLGYYAPGSTWDDR